MAEERPEGTSSAVAAEEDTTQGGKGSPGSAPTSHASDAAPSPPAFTAPSPDETPPAPSLDVRPADVSDPFSGSDAAPKLPRFSRSALGLLFAWMLLSAGLCYLVATQLPGKPLELGVAAAILAALGALLGFAFAAEREASRQRLDAELQRASKILRSIEAVTDPGLAFLDLQDLLAAVLTRTKDAIGGDVVCVLLADDTDPARPANPAVLTVRASQGAQELAPVGSEVRVGDGVLGAAARWARPVVVADARGDGAGSLPESQRRIASLLAAPLIVHGNNLGLVEVGSLRQRSFGPADLRLLQVVADRLAALVARARLDDVANRSRYGAEHANMHLRILARGGTVLGNALESYDTALEELGAVVVPEFADWFGVHVVDATGKVQRLVARAQPKMLGGHSFKRAGHPHPRGDDLVRLAVAERRAQLLVPTKRLGDAALGASVHTPETLGEWPDVTSLLVVPVQVRGEVVATLSFVTGPGRRGYRPSDLATAGELAERVAVAVDRVRSWRESQRSGEMAFEYAERLRRLVDASLVVNAPLREGEVLDLLVEHAHRALGAEVTVVSALPIGGPLAERVWPAGHVVAHAGSDDDLSGLVLTASDLVTRSGEVVRRPDEWSGAREGADVGAGTPPSGVAAAAAAALRVRGWLAAPITDGAGEVRRVIVAVGRHGAAFTFEDESVITLLAQMASGAVRNARLYAEVRGNEQRLQTLVDSSPLAIAEVRANGQAEWWNRAAAVLFGWPDHSAPRTVPVRPGSEAVLDGLLGSAFGGEPVIGAAVPVTGAGEEPLELSVSASPLGPPGEVTGVLLVAEDVTERHRMLEQFHQAERLNAMSRMAGAVAHDFNNLLTVILGCADVLMRRVGDDEELGPDVGAIHRAGTRAAALTSQLVRIGGQQHPLQPEPVAVDEVVSSMQPMLAGVLGEDVRLRIEGGIGSTEVLIDRGELERSILNFAINARDAMPAGGTFTIATSLARARRSSGSGFVEVVFADTGVGMDEETAAHCFEPFFTTKGRARGTGLGLAAAHAMVVQAGGDVRLETAPGSGARFTLTFPAVRTRAEPGTEEPRPTAAAARTAAPALEAPAPATGPAPERARGRGPGSAPGPEPAPAPSPARATGGEPGGTVLVVDDEREVLRLEVRELESAGFEVLEAANASEALHLLQARGGAVDLLVTDVVMPGMSGIELAAAVRFSYPGTRVLFVSGHLDEEAAVKGPLPEEASLLTKPFSPDELTRRVREAIAEKGEKGTEPADPPSARRDPDQGSKR
ncbi:MAG: GAF domain-containing protein [Actinomycetota bacterium]|nr:GAF domain-containing protein [Actinomycetota bacterium]